MCFLAIYGNYMCMRNAQALSALATSARVIHTCSLAGVEMYINQPPFSFSRKKYSVFAASPLCTLARFALSRPSLRLRRFVTQCLLLPCGAAGMWLL